MRRPRHGPGGFEAKSAVIHRKRCSAPQGDSNAVPFQVIPAFTAGRCPAKRLPPLELRPKARLPLGRAVRGPAPDTLFCARACRPLKPRPRDSALGCSYGVTPPLTRHPLPVSGAIKWAFRRDESWRRQDQVSAAIRLSAAVRQEDCPLPSENKLF